MKNEFLNKLFNYYDLTLKIDNVLGVEIKENDISNYSFIDTIEDEYLKSLGQSSFFNVNSTDLSNFKPIDTINNLDIFINKLSILEKAINLNGAKLNKNKSVQAIFEHENFIFSKEANQYQYGIVYNLISKNAYGNPNKLIPCFVVLFPNQDDSFKQLTPGEIFIKIRQYLNMELSNIEEKIASEINIQPYLVFNSKILEPYLLETPEINYSNHEELKETIKTYLQTIIDSKRIKEEDLSKRFLQTEFIIGISQNLNMGLTKIYNSISEYNNINNLIKSYFSVHDRKESEFTSTKINKEEIIDSRKVISSYSNHLGSFDKEYALADTQRDALTCYLDDKEILPINGAPGTGKTSLLRAIFGDYTVKSALETYENYIKNKSIVFSTPIVCSSTNNQALSNVSEGIENGFSKVIDDYPNTNLYSRWINDTDKIKFSNTLFVPSIKGSKKTKYELTKSDILNICNSISKNPVKFLNEYFKYRENEIRFDKPNKRTLDDLKDAAKYFHSKIKDNVKIIQNLTSHITEETTKLANLEQDIIVKYTKKGVQEELIKATLDYIKSTIINSPLVLAKYNKLQNEYDYTCVQREKIITDIKILEEHHLSIESNLIKFTNTLELINNDIKIEESYLDNHMNSPIYNETEEQLKHKHYNTLMAEKELILAELKQSILDLKNEVNIIDRIAYGLFKKGKMKDLIEKFNEDAKEKTLILNQTFWEQDFFQIELLETIKHKHLFKIKELSAKLTETEVQITNTIEKDNLYKIKVAELEKFINEIDYKKRKIELELDESFEILSENVFEIKDIKKILEYKDTYINLNNLKHKNSEFDKKFRTDNFYYAIHLLESLFFISNLNIWESQTGINKFTSKSIVCPSCYKNTLSITINPRNSVKCTNNSCGVEYSFNEKSKNPEKLNIYEIEHIIKHKKALINEQMYYVNINSNYINISTSTAGKEEFSFNDIYPIFPLINITCNSFGTVVSSKGTRKISENIFNFMLIDEAGTIPPSKMIILNCAKRVMFFGDVKQLKPVFAYDSKNENRILKDFFKTKEDIEYIARFFSCAAKTKEEFSLKKNNNAMFLGNACCNYFLPYNKSRMEGDIWLKEHFRCQSPIIDISNEISYYNEVIPCKPQHKKRTWDNLQFIEHTCEKSKNNTNIGEIEEIIKFLQTYKKYYIKRFLEVIKTDKDGVIPELTDQDYFNSIGIITPFSNQENLLKTMIKEKFGCSPENVNEPIIKVGTVHKFQGSERETIIFSSVYNTESIGKCKNLFFNREDPDMINVAVTRAKEIFILFGNKEVLKDEETYSGVMLKHIDKFQNSKNLN
jgi:hypothetical protein